MASNVEENLKVERELRASLQDSIVKDKTQISRMNQELVTLKGIAEVNDGR